jgi:hypothetical protein
VRPDAMIVLSHRGWWLETAEKNARVAFCRSFAAGFGTETDIRDDGRGGLVISHDPPRGGEMPLTEFLALLPSPDLPLAMNVKADGLAVPLRDAMRAAGHRAWFAFDMSVPDMVQQLRAGVPVYRRRSEYESGAGRLDAGCVGTWLDGFEGEWWDAATVEALLNQGAVCIVSPELHGRPHLAAWDQLRSLAGRPGLMLCTDLPDQAQAFFQGHPP